MKRLTVYIALLLWAGAGNFVFMAVVGEDLGVAAAAEGEGEGEGEVLTTVISSTAPDPTYVSPIPITIVFGAPVTGFEESDIVVTNGMVANFGGTDASYSFDVAPDGIGLVSIALAAGAAEDLAGNPSEGADFTISYGSERLVPYQGLLLQANGEIPEAGPLDLVFMLFSDRDDPENAAVWGELHTDVFLLNGAFSVLLGAGGEMQGVAHAPIEEVFTGVPLWVDLRTATIDDYPVLGEGEGEGEFVGEGEGEGVGEGVGEGEPPVLRYRQLLASAPYAYTADTAITATHGVPVGTIAAWGGHESSVIPVGWLACDGAEHGREGTYAALYEALGGASSPYGQGDESTTFNVPNFGGHALMAENTSGASGINGNSAGQTPSSAGLTTHNLGDFVGAEEVAVGVSQMGSHDHGYTDQHSTGNDWSHEEFDPFGIFNTKTFWYTYDINWGYTDPGGGSGTDGTPHENMQPSKVVTFIIKY